MNKTNYFYVLKYRFNPVDYMIIKKYAVDNGERIISGIYYDEFSKDEDTKELLRLYKISYDALDGYGYELVCQFCDYLSRINSIYLIDDYAKPAIKNSYYINDLHEILKWDGDAFKQLFTKLGMDTKEDI